MYGTQTMCYGKHYYFVNYENQKETNKKIKDFLFFGIENR